MPTHVKPASARASSSHRRAALEQHEPPRHPSHHPGRRPSSTSPRRLDRGNSSRPPINEADNHDLIDPDTLRAAPSTADAAGRG